MSDPAPSRATSPPRQHRVVLESFEAVVDGGVRRVTWQLEYEGRWTAAERYPGARVEATDFRPGTVWRRSTFLRLPTGTAVLRFESRPARARTGDPMEVLLGGRGNRPDTVRTRFRVCPRGTLRRDAPPPTPARRSGS